MGPIGNGAQGVWGTRGMGHMGNGSHGQWDTGGMGHMGNEAHWGVWIQGYGTQGVWGTRGMGHVGNGIQGYGPHGQWGPWVICSQNIKKMSSCQKDVKLSKRCQMSENETPRLWRRFTKKLN